MDGDGDLGMQLRLLRVRLRLRQYELAAAAGLSAPTLSEIECGRRRIDADQARRIVETALELAAWNRRGTPPPA